MPEPDSMFCQKCGLGMVGEFTKDTKCPSCGHKQIIEIPIELFVGKEDVVK